MKPCVQVSSDDIPKPCDKEEQSIQYQLKECVAALKEMSPKDLLLKVSPFVSEVCSKEVSHALYSTGADPGEFGYVTVHACMHALFVIAGRD